MMGAAILHSVSYAGLWGQAFLPVDAFVDKAAALGYEGVMLMAKRPHASVLDYGPQEREHLRRRLEQRNLSVVCLAGYTNFTADLAHGDIPHREIQIHYVENLVNKGVKLDWPGGCSGVVVNRLKGANWQPQGTAVNFWLGPFFGADENTMAVIGTDGVNLTQDAGKTWTRVAASKPRSPGYSFSANWFGCYAWDPIHHVIYASAMGNPVYKLDVASR